MRVRCVQLGRSTALAASLLVAVGCAGSGAELDAARAELEACQQARAQAEGDRDTARADAQRAQGEGEKLRLLLEQRVVLDRDLRQKLKALVDSGKLTIAYRRGLLVLQMPNDILFDSGKAKVKGEAEATLREVATALTGGSGDRRILVTGHTDNMPIKDKSKGYKSNWQLSTARAQAVADILLAANLEPGRVGVAGFGEYDPVADNGSAEGKGQNRRTEIVLVPNLQDVLHTTGVFETGSTDAVSRR